MRGIARVGDGGGEKRYLVRGGEGSLDRKYLRLVRKDRFAAAFDVIARSNARARARRVEESNARIRA